MLNLGVVAHVDAGKTSLTERLLFDSGAIDRLGSVDGGDTTTDGMALERRRGITIRSAVAAFTLADRQVHLIDTPGHTDFVAEVERALGVLDGAILVLSAVEGVQAHTRVLMRTLRAAKVPTILFVNKIDRPGARYEDLLADIRRLTPAAIPLNFPVELGTKSADAIDRAPDLAWAEVLAERSDAALQSYVDGVDRELLKEELRAQARQGLVYPVLFGSAVTGAGITALRKAIVDLLPSVDPDVPGELDGVVFAVEHNGGRTAVARLFAGSLATRDRIDGVGVATDVRDARGERVRVRAGGIARIAGLPGLRIGDRLGTNAGKSGPSLRRPTLETVVTAASPARLFDGLSRLADQDPLIDVRRGPGPGSLVVSLHGDVQREVIAARLAEEFGVAAEFSAPRVACVERLKGVGQAVTYLGETLHVATIGLRVEPGDSVFRLEAERGSLPAAFITAIEETVLATLREGLHGWPVIECTVTLTHTGYESPVSVAADFRGLTPLVLAEALRRAETVVCEPLEEVDLEVPEASLTAVLSTLTRHGGLPRTPLAHNGSVTITAVLPTARLREFQRLLPGLTGGEGVLTANFAGYSSLRNQ
jgi:ribosomal protection tetracycline resistance protein